jgi:hypothetical protein
MSTPASTASQSAKLPEAKFSYAAGIGCAVWRNTIETADGRREMRSITLSPRRYLDRQTGEWKDGTYRPSDIPILLVALQRAMEYVYTTPLSGREEEPDAHGVENGDIPY